MSLIIIMSARRSAVSNAVNNLLTNAVQITCLYEYKMYI